MAFYASLRNENSLLKDVADNRYHKLSIYMLNRYNRSSIYKIIKGALYA